MKRILVLITLILGATSLFAIDAKKMARETADVFEAGVRAGNADLMASIYADDAILMPPNAPMQKGKAAIREFWAGMNAMGKADLRITIDDVMVSGNAAIERGTWKLTLTPNGAATPVNDNGKYVIVWWNKNGKWQIVQDIYNSDNAPAP